MDITPTWPGKPVIYNTLNRNSGIGLQKLSTKLLKPNIFLIKCFDLRKGLFWKTILPESQASLSSGKVWTKEDLLGGGESY